MDKLLLYNMVDKTEKIKKDARTMIFEEDLYEGDPRNLGQQLWRVEIGFGNTLTGDKAQEASDLLEEIAVSIFLHNREATDGDNWIIEMITLGKPDTGDIQKRIDSIGKAAITAQPVEQKDWLSHVHDNFPPLTIGGFFVYGSHYTGDLPAGLIPLKIDAATAFGSGEHETTRGCLELLQDLKTAHDLKNGLDMGCGSGILAIGMAKLWLAMKITAIDIDPESARVTAVHAGMNNAEKHIDIAAGDGYKTPLAAQNAPYDVIVANILAGPLVAMAPDLDKMLKPGGFAVLSGLLARQKDDVVRAHEACGLVLKDTRSINDWQALLLQKPLGGL